MFKNEIVFCVYFFWYLQVSENIAISRYHDSLIAPIRLVCSVFKKVKNSTVFVQICSEDIHSYLQNLNLVK